MTLRRKRELKLFFPFHFYADYSTIGKGLKRPLPSASHRSVSKKPQVLWRRRRLNVPTKGWLLFFAAWLCFRSPYLSKFAQLPPCSTLESHLIWLFNAIVLMPFPLPPPTYSNFRYQWYNSSSSSPKIQSLSSLSHPAELFTNSQTLRFRKCLAATPSSHD